MKQRIFAILLSLAMMFTLVPTAMANDAEERSAVKNITANSGTLATGDYILPNNIDLTDNLVIPSGAVVTIDLNGHTLKGNGNGSVITVSGELTLLDSTAKSATGLATGTEGVVFNADGSVTVTYAVYDKDDNLTYRTYTSGAMTGGVGATDSEGGGITVTGGSVIMNGGIITGNTPKPDTQYSLGGGIYIAYQNGSFTMNNGVVCKNTAASTVQQGSGGGVYVGGTFEMNGGAFCFNEAKGVNANGGAAFIQGTFTAKNAVFSGNTSERWTGGLCGAVTLENCILVNNYAGNVTDAYGGAMSGSGKIKACVVSHNSAPAGSGGGLYLNGPATVTDSYIQYNTAAKSGGGIAIPSQSDWSTRTKVTISSSVIQSNTAQAGDGAGIDAENNVELEVLNTTIKDNKALGTDSYGGGIALQATSLTLSGENEISENTASFGGGIRVGSKTVMIQDGTVIQKNTAQQGAGIWARITDDFFMNGGAITENHATEMGGGIYFESAHPQFSGNAVVSSNTSGNNQPDNVIFNETNTTYIPTLSGKLGEASAIGITRIPVTAGQTIVGASGYTITESDLTHFTYDGNGYVLDLDKEQNVIKATTAAVITFNSNTGEDSNEVIQNARANTTVELKANTFTSTGYTFTGWNTSSDGSGTAYADKANISASENVTLYAQWRVRRLSGIEVVAKNANVPYGTILSADNFKVTAVYDNGERKPVTEFSVSPNTALTTPGTVQVTVTYQGKTQTCGITVDKASQAAPTSAPTLKDRTYTSITLNTVEPNTNGAAAQYSKDGGKTWQDSAEFTDLTSNTTYTFVVRYAEKAPYAASAASATAEFSTLYRSSGSSSDPTYSVTTPSASNGSVTVSPKNAKKGDTVTITVKPDSGYVLDDLTVTDKNGNELTLKDKGNGKYTFVMPAGKVEVKATFMDDNTMLNFFVDVKSGDYYYDAVLWAAKNGITSGTDAVHFSPEQPCTRAQIVTFLWRAAGAPEPKGTAASLTDVASGSYYEKAVAWAIENGITAGTGEGKFSPDATCTRAQAVTFLARALNAKAASAAEFSDVPTDSYFADAVAWAAANGVTEGIGGSLFGSDNDCTRGQIVTFLYRAYNK